MSSPVTYQVEYPEKLSHGMPLIKYFFGWLYVLIPHGFCLFFYQIAVGIVLFISFWAILFTGKFPRGMFDFVIGALRWQARVIAYMYMMTDEYPPFSGSE